MIGSGTCLDVSDNSGAREVKCVNQSGLSFGVGDTITVAVQRASGGKVTAGQVCQLPCLDSVAVVVLQQPCAGQSQQHDPNDMPGYTRALLPGKRTAGIQHIVDCSCPLVTECMFRRLCSIYCMFRLLPALKLARLELDAPCMQVHKAVITQTKKEFSRPDGSFLKFDKNACVLVGGNGQPLGSRVLGFATHELRSRNMLKILSLATRVI